MRDAHGACLRILEADQTVYLHPRATRPAGPAIEVGSDVLPDVVLEVDNTTDVRRGKLSLYESFPGWTAQEIHRALNEAELSDATTAALRRIGRTLGAAEGTGPDDDPFLRAERVEGHVAGRVAGRREGHEAGRLETQSAAVLQVFKSRGLPVSAALPRRLADLHGVSTATLVQAALECRDEQHLLRLVSDRR